MAGRHITYQEVIKLIQDINVFVDSMDTKIKSTQKNYATAKQKMVLEQKNNLTKFDADCQKAVEAIASKARNMQTEAKKIQEEINGIDLRLSVIDKYYVKTKQKKMVELAGIQSDKYSNNPDYFGMLEQIKGDFFRLSSYYSDNVLPAIINGLNYIFSNNRKKDYEELIILENTVDAFVEEIDAAIPEIMAAETLELKNRNAGTRCNTVNQHKREMQALEKQYAQAIDNLSGEIISELDRILPDELIMYIADLYKIYSRDFEKVNNKEVVSNNVFSIGYISYHIDTFVESRTLAELLYEKCEKIVKDGSIVLPIVSSAFSYVPYYVTYNSREEMKDFIDYTLFSYLSQTMVGKIQVSVVDAENHGNSIETFYDLKNKLPDVFGGSFLIRQEDISNRIRTLNDKVEDIRQNKLGSKYQNIFAFIKDHADYDYRIELLIIYDFPCGLSDIDISIIKNLLQVGFRCGVYVVIAHGQINVQGGYGESLSGSKTIQQHCIGLQLKGENNTFFGLPYAYTRITDKKRISGFFSKYMIMYENMQNKAITFSSFISPLIESSDDLALMREIKNIKNLSESCNSNLGKTPALNVGYPKYIVVGNVHYPSDIFEDAHGYELIKKNFQDVDGKIKLPLVMDIRNYNNSIFIESDESTSILTQELIHGVIWAFMSTMPITKLNICVCDCEKKGGSIIPFLEIKKKNPALFDQNIHTSADDVNERLKKINSQIDECIMNKLGGTYSNIIDYNTSNPARGEAITLLVINDYPSGFDSRSIELLFSILKNGSKCGVYTVINYNKDVPFSRYENIDEYNAQMTKNMAKFEVKDTGCYLAPFNLLTDGFSNVSSSTAMSFSMEYLEKAEMIKNKGLDFKDILDKELFQRESDSSLSIPVGMGDENKIISLTFGKGSSHHALIAGATGSGKSTLLHTLIMSSMLHYSPNELNLYLMDFKSGTEFKIYDNYRLPHIKLLALDAMQEFGESILENLVKEIDTRSNYFKDNDVTKLGKTPQKMARILVIMDEFQVLFNDSTNRKVAYHCAELAKRIVTEGRSYGIHLLMATQSTKIISDLTISTGTIEQMRIRIGLKCGEDDARYLFTDKNDSDALEKMKGPIGTAVLNSEYTEDENVGFRAAYCDGDTQNHLLKVIEDKFASAEYTLQTFEGNRTKKLLDVFKTTDEHEFGDTTIRFGELIKVAPPYKITYDKKQKHNTIICGADERMANNLFHLICLSVLKSKTACFYCLDGDTIVGEDSLRPYYEQFGRFGTRFRLAESRGEIIEIINEIFDVYKKKKKKNDSSSIFVGIKNFQFLDIVKKMMRGEYIDESEYLDNEENHDDLIDEANAAVFDFGVDSGTPESLGVSEKLQKLLDDGAAYGIHFVLSCTEYQSIKENMYYGENVLSKFPERFIFALNDNDADSLIEGVTVAALRDNTVYYTDSIKSKYQMKPYLFPELNELSNYIDAILK